MSTNATGVKAMVRRTPTRTSKTRTSKRAPAARRKKTAEPTQRTRIFFLLDSSGSMDSVRDDAIAGFNAFVSDQREMKDGEVTLSLTYFDTQPKPIYSDADLSLVRDLNRITYRPMGGTALYDAVGLTIRNNVLSRDHKDAKTIVAIFTDGEENSSTQFNYSDVADLIKTAQEDYGWEILFLGSQLRAVEVARSMGIKVTNTVVVEPTAMGLQGAMKSMSYGTRAYRGDFLSSSSGAAYSANSLNMQNLYDDSMTNSTMSSASTGGLVGSSTVTDLKKFKKDEEKK